jgi:ABC-2 type transport system ATP-binding protein
VIEVEGLTKHYGSYVAVEGVSFRVAPGEIVGFLGPNGAGKSTTLRMLAGYLGPTAGRVRVAGHDMLEAPSEAKRALGYMPETCPLYPEMRVAEYLRFRASLKGVPGREREAHVTRALGQAKLEHVREVRIGELSKGYKQRVGLADALVADPPVLVLDEPTAGLDPNQIREVRDLLRAIAPQKAILLSTHILGEVDAICTRVVVLAKGRVVAEGPIEELVRRRARSTSAVRFRGEAEAARAVAAGFAEIEGADVEAGAEESRLRVTWREGVAAARAEEIVEAIVEGLVAAKLKVRGVEAIAAAGGADLEAIFALLTKSEGAGAGEVPGAAPSAKGARGPEASP